MKKEIKIPGLDADDTLWMNETYYRDTAHESAKLLSGFGDEKEIVEQLFLPWKSETFHCMNMAPGDKVA